MRLADFIEDQIEAIVSAAADFASTMMPAAAHLDTEALRDHIPMILLAVAKDLRTPQTAQAGLSKSLGQQPRAHAAPETAAQTHALLRAKAGFDIEQIVAEYRAMRACVLRLWLDSTHAVQSDATTDIVRFNEAIDQAVAESVAYFTAEIDRWRHVFLGVLGHDLRGPLNAILLTAEVLSRLTTDAPVTRHTGRLIQSGKRMKTLLDDLLEFSRSSLGMGFSVHRVEADLASACRDEIDVLCAAMPRARIDFSVKGDTRGSYDVSRVREVLGNLVSNAARYADADTSVDVRLAGDDHRVILSVENTGAPIAAAELLELFEPLRRGQTDDMISERANLGLGLFIVREIARAHDGDIAVTSIDGRTRFALTLPRKVA